VDEPLSVNDPVTYLLVACTLLDKAEDQRACRRR
jgi:hypothetical protein